MKDASSPKRAPLLGGGGGKKRAIRAKLNNWESKASLKLDSPVPSVLKPWLGLGHNTLTPARMPSSHQHVVMCSTVVVFCCCCVVVLFVSLLLFLFIHRNHKLNKQVQETEKQCAYLSVTSAA